MDPQLQTAFQFASDLSKQLITVSSGILVLGVTFAKDILKKPTRRILLLLASSWSLYVLSILAGLWSLMSLTGDLAPRSDLAPLKDIPDNARLSAGVQVLFFAAATVIFLVIGVYSLLRLRDGQPAPNTNTAPDANRAPRGRRR